MSIFTTAKKCLILSALAIGLFASVSCEKKETNKPTRIKVNVIETRTKAPGDYISMNGENVTSTLESNGFVLDAYVDDIFYDYSTNPKTEYPAGKYVNSGGSINVTKSSKWDISGNPTWVSDVKTQFWAYYPAIFKGSIDFNDVASPYNSMSFNYKMPDAKGTTDASANFDDPVFCHVEQQFDGSNEAVDMTFHHALAQVRFCVSLDNSDSDKCDEGIDITKIELCGIKNKGICTFTGDNTFSWSGQDGDYVFGQTVGGFASSDWENYTVGTYDGKLCKYGFYVIPQSARSVSIKVTITNGSKTVTSQKDIPASHNWAADNYYTYKLSIKGDALANITLVSANAQHQAFDQFINLEY